MRKFATLLILTFTASAILTAETWKDGLEVSLSSRYTFTKTSKLGATTVTAPGTILIARADGLTAGMPTKVVSGKVIPPGGVTMALLLNEDKHSFRTGDRFYITKIYVRDDSVTLSLISADPTDVGHGGTTSQRRWMVALQFEFPKNYIRASSAEKIAPLIDAIIQREGDALAIQTRTIQMGQTRAEVESILGKPETIADLGMKMIYSYRSLKVVFTDGKVSDVQ